MRPISNHLNALAATSALIIAGGAAAQTVHARFSPSTVTVAPGASAVISLYFEQDTSGFSSGFFGPPGFYGYSGDIFVDVAGPAPVLSIFEEISSVLPSGQFLEVGSSPVLVRSAAGRGTDGAITNAFAPAAGFELFVEPGTPDSDLLIGFEGTAVLSLGDELVTFSTVPGINQGVLGNDPLLLQIRTPPPCVGDVTTTGATVAGQAGFGVPDGVADLDDLGYLLNFWVSGLPEADLTTTGASLNGQPGFGEPDGAVDLDDLGYFLNFWVQGCA